MLDVAVIGCGIVGAAAAYTLSRYELSVAVLEKENDVADATTKANSAILHAGYDPQPGTCMARLNVEGALLAKQLCASLDVPYKAVGSLVLAFGEEDEQTLRTLYERGIANGVPGLELWDAGQVRAREPLVSGQVTAALYAPTAAVVNPWEYALALAETAVKNGVELHRRCEVTAIEKIPGGYRITTTGGVWEARCVVNAAGVQTDRIHDMIAPHAFDILPNRGQYYLLDKAEGEKVKHVLFQCPNRDGKGVLVAPTVHGNLIVGPNAESCGTENTATTAQGLAFVAAAAQKTMPSLQLRASIRNFAGIRAKTAQEDFWIAEAENAPGFIDAAGIASPGLTAAPAIAQEIVKLLSASGLPLQEKAMFNGTRRRLRFAELPPEQKDAKIRENPAYGRVICRCETITEGEILDALHSPIPPCSIDGIKRRCNAGMGRCQGGFCGPRVLEILARESGLPPEKILLDKDGSFVLTGEIGRESACGN